jgi:hypothetical protein
MHLQALEKIHRQASGCCRLHLLLVHRLQNFVWLNLFFYESFEVILHSSDQAQVPLEGGLPDNTFFFYLSSNHFRVDANDASLDPNGIYLWSLSNMASYLLCY